MTITVNLKYSAARFQINKLRSQKLTITRRTPRARRLPRHLLRIPLELRQA